jgi:hypothetical protein
MKWINVTEKLPPEMEEVDVVYNSIVKYRISGCFYYKGKFMKNWIELDNITHWIFPLPLP